ncbi:hypothetical protein DM01DRAFT_1324274 [Hesseltinella vesiculosa]|uniref:Elongation factor Ts, mitochondrial n=1 Tax=Hesseltinella vesiculosa TaxID=101127 RepID=A0A1X2GEC1_9FUNG|nr:hypothetical protein DM01DRAFT_1324274 [Hesseltinella vesiculosa]
MTTMLKTWTANRAFIRQYSTAFKPDIKLLAKLRKETEVSMSKAKEALTKADNNYQSALTWLQQDAIASGTKKASKVGTRIAGEGLISTALINNRCSVIELNCETDFVSRNGMFKNLAQQVAATSLFLHEPVDKERCVENMQLDTLARAPMLPTAEGTYRDETVHESIVQAIGKLGENIILRRASVVSQGLSASYVHGGDGKTGKIAGVAVLNVAGETNPEQKKAMANVAVQVARQVVGFAPRFAQTEDVPTDELNSQADQNMFLKEAVLSQQDYLMNPSLTVGEFVDQSAKSVGLEGATVVDFIRWEVGENIEKRADDFANEVIQAAKN